MWVAQGTVFDQNSKGKKSMDIEDDSVTGDVHGKQVGTLHGKSIPGKDISEMGVGKYSTSPIVDPVDSLTIIDQKRKRTELGKGRILHLDFSLLRVLEGHLIPIGPWADRFSSLMDNLFSVAFPICGLFGAYPPGSLPLLASPLE
nr:hypothetical protein Iba_chr15dCG4200 [Ipomoea batatas]GMD98762.1 hypothetical protein Iba_chr15dCG5870 [Ipomoea batatas]